MRVVKFLCQLFHLLLLLRLLHRNYQLPMVLFPTGPQPPAPDGSARQAPDGSVPDRASTPSSHGSVPFSTGPQPPELPMAVFPTGSQLSKFMSDRVGITSEIQGRDVCQIERQNVHQVECQNLCQISEYMSDSVRILVR